MTAPLSHRRETCLLCASGRLELAVEYPATPIADAYLRSPEASVAQPRFALDTYLCMDCGHLQLREVVDPVVLFGDYTYETSVSAGLVAHFARYAQEVQSAFRPAPGALVVEIGSNDGSLLRQFQGAGLRVLGVDPATAIAEKATRAGLETVPAFFSSSLAERLRASHGAAAVVAANNVFAHSEALPDMAEGVRTLLAPDGVFVFEVSYLPSIVERRLFDTVYHEHLSYHAVIPMQRFLAAHGLQLLDFTPIDSKGGSFRGVAQRADGPRRPSPAVGRQVAFEQEHGAVRLETYRRFSHELQEARGAVRRDLEGRRRAGARLAGYGASATVTTLVHHFGLDEFLELVVDDNPKKHGTHVPGTRIPVLPSSVLAERRPDATVILAWCYARPIVTRQEAYRAAGGRFVVPMPHLEIL